MVDKYEKCLSTHHEINTNQNKRGLSLSGKGIGKQALSNIVTYQL